MLNKRMINHIAVEEIAAAILKIISLCFGTSRYSLLSETSKVYGFGNLRTNTIVMNAVVDLLIKSKKVKVADHKLVIFKEEK